MLADSALCVALDALVLATAALDLAFCECVYEVAAFCADVLAYVLARVALDLALDALVLASVALDIALEALVLEAFELDKEDEALVLAAVALDCAARALDDASPALVLAATALDVAPEALVLASIALDAALDALVEAKVTLEAAVLMAVVVSSSKPMVKVILFEVPVPVASLVVTVTPSLPTTVRTPVPAEPADHSSPPTVIVVANVVTCGAKIKAAITAAVKRLVRLAPPV